MTELKMNFYRSNTGDDLQIKDIKAGVDKVYFEIIEFVEDKCRVLIQDMIEKDIEVHPRTFIAVTVTNILVNLFISARAKDIPSEGTLLLMKELLDEITMLANNAAQGLATVEAKNGAAH